MQKFDEHFWFMKIALEEAESAYKSDEVPIGAVVVNGAGEVIARASNLKESNSNPCGHAEVLAIEKAAKELNDWRLVDCRLYVTLEPCVMCLGAMIQSRISKLYFGAYDKKGGALSLNYNFYKDPRLNHRFSVTGGIMHYECSKILSTFFREKRTSYRKKRNMGPNFSGLK